MKDNAKQNQEEKMNSYRKMNHNTKRFLCLSANNVEIAMKNSVERNEEDKKAT